MDDNFIQRLQENVVRFGASQRLREIHIEDIDPPVRHLAEYLRVSSHRIRCESAGHEHRIAQVHLAVNAMRARIAHFSADRNDRRIFKIVTAENTHGVERLELGIVLSIERIGKVESYDLWPKIGLGKPNNFGMRS